MMFIVIPCKMVRKYKKKIPKGLFLKIGLIIGLILLSLFFFWIFFLKANINQLKDDQKEKIGDKILHCNFYQEFKTTKDKKIISREELESLLKEVLQIKAKNIKDQLEKKEIKEYFSNSQKVDNSVKKFIENDNKILSLFMNKKTEEIIPVEEGIELLLYPGIPTEAELKLLIEDIEKHSERNEIIRYFQENQLVLNSIQNIFDIRSKFLTMIEEKDEKELLIELKSQIDNLYLFLSKTNISQKENYDIFLNLEKISILIEKIDKEEITGLIRNYNKKKEKTIVQDGNNLLFNLIKLNKYLAPLKKFLAQKKI